MPLADIVITQPDYRTDQWVSPLLSIAVLFAAVAVVAFLADRQSERKLRAELAATEERAKAKLAAATVPLVVERRVDICAAETTGVITMPPALFRSGRHAAPSLVGAARVPLDLSGLRRRRDGSVRA